MKFLEELKTLFTPYERACGLLLIAYAFFAMGILLLLTGSRSIAMLAALSLSALSSVGAWAFGRCATCGKPALKTYLLNRETGIGQFLFMRRAWPERTCSSCNAALDEEPA